MSPAMGDLERFLRSFIVGGIQETLDSGLWSINERFDIMSAQLDALKAQVAANTTVVQSAVALIQGLKVKLDEAIAANNNGDSGAALQALAAELGSADQTLAAAVAANTPAAPAPAPAPTPAPVAETPAPAPAPADGSVPVETPVPGSTGTPA